MVRPAWRQPGASWQTACSDADYPPGAAVAVAVAEGDEGTSGASAAKLLSAVNGVREVREPRTLNGVTERVTEGEKVWVVVVDVVCAGCWGVFGAVGRTIVV